MVANADGCIIDLFGHAPPLGLSNCILLVIPFMPASHILLCSWICLLSFTLCESDFAFNLLFFISLIQFIVLYEIMNNIILVPVDTV